MTALYSKWYTALVNGLRLDPSKFQLLQPTSPLGPTSDQLWAYFNDLPPSSLVNNLDVSAGNHFYDDYRAVVSQLQSQQGLNFQRDLGDAFSKWQTYVQGLTPPPATLTKLSEVFGAWAQINAISVRQKGLNDIRAMENDPITNAQLAAGDQSGFMNGIPDFTKNISDLQMAIQNAPGATISFDSQTASSDTSQTWAKGSISGAYEFFTGGASASWSKMSAKAAASHISVNATFASVLTFAAVPGSWYSSAALAMAYTTKDNTLWSHGTPDWNSTFGPSGNMQRFLVSLVVVDGVDMTITSDASFSSEEQQSIQASASVGYWPFFSAKASGGYSTKSTFASDGSMKVTISSGRNNPAVLGANVIPVGQYLGG